MRRPSSILALTILAASALLPSSAHGAPADVASTQSYVQADYRLVQTAAGRISVGEAALQSLLRQIRGECPRAAAGSPQDPQSTELSNELIGAMVTAAIHRDLPSIREFVGVSGHLRWSNRGLTNTIQSYVGKLRTLSTLPAPNVCTDVRSWAASDFRTLPASTVAFDARFWPAWVALGELPAALDRYEPAGQRGLMHRAGELEAELSDFESRAVETWGDIMDALELNP